MSEPRFIDKGPAAAPLSGRTSPQHDEQPVERRDASRASEEAPELLPCPFCGAEAAEGGGMVACSNEKCGDVAFLCNTAEQSRAMWNRRVSPSGSGREETLPVEPSEAAIQAAASAGYDEEWESGGDFKLISALRAAYAAERLSTGSPSVSGGEERSKG